MKFHAAQCPTLPQHNRTVYKPWQWRYNSPINSYIRIIVKPQKQAKQQIVKRYDTILDIVGAAIQGTKISRGYFIQWAVADRLKELNPTAEFFTEYPLETTKFKSGKHKVDIVLVDHSNKSCILFSVKSEGISNTDPHNLVGLPQMLDVIESAKIRWPGYCIVFKVLRTGGEFRQEWEDAGIHTYDTSAYIGVDVFNLVKSQYYTKFAENMCKQIKISNIANDEQITFLMTLIPKLLEDIKR